ncbi:hypothetical protein CFter6_0585 [Collimonas fungivorans]|jgi:uncharacterized protein YegP (UPF0339 family)|uniref:DUF1508 domain-containing protein n=2 Tax=Collimonas fungivorans TaxID=158899 RepID=G0AES9_COLFT|nr:YegP family protein [Collimonas fungivorans]AEK60214.1 hypothetical protein CFU_0376 [Collimonas fungivorans Ter331]AMO93314.1 hypothetical protein CFter6_0585 [Collimonas fungivorans]
MAGSYVLKKSVDGQFYFLLYSGNGEVVLNSEMYVAKASAENGIASVQSNSAQDDRYSRNQASNGKFYFNLKAANHQVIGSSQMYSTTSARDAGIDAVKKNGPSTDVKDEA